MRTLPKNVLKAIYAVVSSLVPHTVWNLAWGTVPTPPTLLEDFELIHLRAAKRFHGTTDNSMEGLKCTCWQPFKNIYECQLISLMYYSLASKPICDPFHADEWWYYNIRRTNKYVAPGYIYTIGRNSIRYRGLTAWNMLPNSYKELSNYDVFKQKIKKDLKLMWLNVI